MKKLIFLAIIFLCFNCINAQTYLSPIIGYDFTNMSSKDLELVYFNIEDSKFGANSLLYGLEIKQKIKNRFYISLSSSYLKKHISGWTPFGVHLTVDGMVLNYFQNSLKFSYKQKKYLFSAGFCYNIMKDLTTELDYKKSHKPFIEKLDERGIRISFGKTYKNFNLEAYFYKGLTSNLSDIIQLNSLKSLGILLSYDIKVFNGFKKKSKADCPKF